MSGSRCQAAGPGCRTLMDRRYTGKAATGAGDKVRAEDVTGNSIGYLYASVSSTINALTTACVAGGGACHASRSCCSAEAACSAAISAARVASSSRHAASASRCSCSSWCTRRVSRRVASAPPMLAAVDAAVLGAMVRLEGASCAAGARGVARGAERVDGGPAAEDIDESHARGCGGCPAGETGGVRSGDAGCEACGEINWHIESICSCAPRSRESSDPRVP